MKKLVFSLILFGVVFYSCEKENTPAPIVVVDNNDTIKVDSVKKDTIVKPDDTIIRALANIQRGWCLTKYTVGFTGKVDTFEQGSITWGFNPTDKSLTISSDIKTPELDTGKYTYAVDMNGVCNSKIRLLVDGNRNLGSVSFDANKMIITGECYDGGRLEFELSTEQKWFENNIVKLQEPFIYKTPIKEITAPPIDFSNPQVGQKLVYLNYRYNCNDSLKRDFKYLGDTMVLEVVEKDSKLHFKETFSKSSSQVANVGVDTRVPAYPIKVENSNILFNNMRSLSGLFYFYGNDTLQLQPVRNAIATQTNCNVSIDTTVFTGNEIALIASFKVGDYDITDKTIVSCVPQVIDIWNGYLVYDKNKLFASQILTWEGVSGWVLMDKYR